MGRISEWLERHLVAAALAEEGLRAEAARLAGGGRPPRAQDALAALLAGRGVRLFCGALSPAALAPRR